MEWGKAKSILIVTFLGLNMLLAYQLWINKSNPISADFEISAEETHALLRSKGIRLDKPIPTLTPTLREITIQFNDYYNPLSKKTLETAVADSEQANKQKLEEVLAEQIPHADMYWIDPILSDSRKYVLSQIYNELPMFDVNIVLYNEGGMLSYYTQSFADVVSTDEEREQRILSAYQAVGFLVENYLQNGSIISDVTLGYHGQSYDSATQVLAPKWRIVLDTGDIYYVHGINGVVEIPHED